MTSTVDTAPGPFDLFLESNEQLDPVQLPKIAAYDNVAITEQFFREATRLPYNPNSPTSMERWMLSQLNPVLDSLRLHSQCSICSATYQPLHNLGTWKCRWHPGQRLPNGTFTCCNRKTERGCKRCDHSPLYKPGQRRWRPEQRRIKVPSYLVPNILTFPLDAKPELWWRDDNQALSYYTLNRAEF